MLRNCGIKWGEIPALCPNTVTIRYSRDPKGRQSGEFGSVLRGINKIWFKWNLVLHGSIFTVTWLLGNCLLSHFHFSNRQTPTNQTKSGVFGFCRWMDSTRNRPEGACASPPQQKGKQVRDSTIFSGCKVKPKKTRKGTRHWTRGCTGIAHALLSVLQLRAPFSAKSESWEDDRYFYSGLWFLHLFCRGRSESKVIGSQSTKPTVSTDKICPDFFFFYDFCSKTKTFSMKWTYTVANLINQMDTFQKICFLKKTKQKH